MSIYNYIYICVSEQSFAYIHTTFHIVRIFGLLIIILMARNNWPPYHLSHVRELWANLPPSP